MSRLRSSSFGAASLRREKSLRKDARERYLELAEKDAPHPDPLPASGEREKKEGGGESVPSLTERVRALYEEDVVPVRELAALAGVTERTLYKYIEKGGWRRRYAVRGVEAAATNRGRKLVAQTRFAPVKGAGGRFIRREDAGLPHARGIKALDPEGAQDAAAKAERAAALSAKAAHLAALSKLAKQGMAAQAKHERAEDARIRCFEKLMVMMLDLSRARRAPHIHPRADAVAEKMQHMIMDMVESIMLPSPLP